MRKLVRADCIQLLQHVEEASVDAVIADPPYNSGRDWAAFDDRFGPPNPEELNALSADLRDLVGLVARMHSPSMAGYVCFMAARLSIIARCMKPSASIYLFCDDTANGYLRLVMDSVFGRGKFCNELVWKRSAANNLPGSKWKRDSDRILFYRGPGSTWNQPWLPHDPEYVRQHYRPLSELHGRHAGRLADVRGGDGGVMFIERNMEPGLEREAHVTPACRPAQGERPGASAPSHKSNAWQSNAGRPAAVHPACTKEEDTGRPGRKAKESSAVLMPEQLKGAIAAKQHDERLARSLPERMPAAMEEGRPARLDAADRGGTRARVDNPRRGAVHECTSNYASEHEPAKRAKRNTAPFLGVSPPPGRAWRWKRETMERLHEEGRLLVSPTGKSLRYIRFLDETPGQRHGSLFLADPPPSSREYKGWPTAKPEALIRRLVEASSNPGDVVLDPFMGSGTTLAVAEALGRGWAGFDRQADALRIARARMEEACHDLFGGDIEVLE